MLLVPLSSIGDDGLEIEAVVPVSPLQPDGVPPLPVREVAISGHMEPLGEDYLFMGQIAGVFESTCDRCLQAAEMPFEIEIAWNFERNPQQSFAEAGLSFDEEVDLSDSAVCRPIVGEEIDLGPHIWEELVLAAPFKFLCGEACQGMCPTCGANLNAGPCGCPVVEASTSVEEAGRGFAGLAKMFPELTAEQRKERPEAQGN